MGTMAMGILFVFQRKLAGLFFNFLIFWGSDFFHVAGESCNNGYPDSVDRKTSLALYIPCKGRAGTFSMPRAMHVCESVS